MRSYPSFTHISVNSTTTGTFAGIAYPKTVLN